MEAQGSAVVSGAGSSPEIHSQVRVAIAGVGSCASSFVQTVEQVRRVPSSLVGIMLPEVGGYRLQDVSFVAAFDVDRAKVGLELSKAIFRSPTAAVAHVDVEPQDVTVDCGFLMDGIGGRLEGVISPAPEALKVTLDDVVQRLSEVDADVLLCLLPTGSTSAVQAYGRAAALASVAFVNATPEPVAHDDELVALFIDRGVPLLGDDLRSHLGATTLHTALLELLQSRNLEVVNTYQLNIGGNTDFLNLSDPSRASGKVKTKRSALQAAGIDASRVAAGPNGYVEFLGDTKTCFLRIEANSVLDSRLVLDIRMEVEDSPNAAGVLASAVRVAKLAQDRRLVGVIDQVCPLLFKRPRVGAPESVGLGMFHEFVGSGGAAAPGHRDEPRRM